MLFKRVFKIALMLLAFAALAFCCYNTIVIKKQVKRLAKKEDANTFGLLVLKNFVADYSSLYEKIASFFLVYDAYDKDGKIELLRIGRSNDGGYVAPEKAMRNADVLLGYGIADDISFEEDFSKIYKKPSFGFDCGIKSIKTNSNLVTFISDCIGSDKHLYSQQKSHGRTVSFDQQLKELNLANKKILIKLDIEGAEYDVFEDILKHSDQITGIVMELHFFNQFEEFKAFKLLSSLQDKFLLLHVHGNNYVGLESRFSARNVKGKIPKAIELAYINKSLVDKYQVSANQSHPTKIDMPCNCNAPEAEFEITRDSIAAQ